jgi:hypothetical protein
METVTNRVLCIEYPTYDLVMSFDTENIDITVVQIGNIDTAWFNSMLVPTDDESSLKFNFSIIVTIGGPLSIIIGQKQEQTVRHILRKLRPSCCAVLYIYSC